MKYLLIILLFAGCSYNNYNKIENFLPEKATNIKHIDNKSLYVTFNLELNGKNRTYLAGYYTVNGKIKGISSITELSR